MTAKTAPWGRVVRPYTCPVTETAECMCPSTVSCRDHFNREEAVRGLIFALKSGLGWEDDPLAVDAINAALAAFPGVES